MINLPLKSTDKLIFALAIPMILSNITVPLLGLVDTAVIGHLSHAYYLGGSSVGAMIITFITWLCGFLRMSTTGLSAQALGSEDTDKALQVLVRGLLVAFAIGVTLILLQAPYLDIALYLAGGSDQVQHYARQYAEIRVWGLPAALANIVLLGWLLGQHKAKAVMWLLIFTNSVNLILDLVFVLVFDWKVAGVAWATLIAEYSSLIVGLVVVSHIIRRASHSLTVSSLMSLAKDLAGLGQYFKLNRDILIRTLCLEICFVFITFQGARLGDNVVAANAILLNFLLLISFGLDGIANAAEALVGKAHGKKDTLHVQQIVRRSLLWTVVFAAGYSLLFTLLGNSFVGLMSSIDEVVNVAQQFLPWIYLLPLISCWCYLYDGIYIGLTRADIMRNSMVLSTFGIFFPLWWIFSTFGNHGLWLAFSGFMLSRGLTLGWYYYCRGAGKAIAV
ncbi:MATE family efflux transporter [Thalassotalea euphylliae]|uniref:MATE family efflux transporter n=1 Tax=Thalassotalea euphylliae TaxID=1655234 RepID=UPI00362B6406